MEKIMRRFGYTPEQKATNAVIELIENNRITRENDAKELHAAYSSDLNELRLKYEKPAPKLKKDVKEIIAAILSAGFKQIGIIQDEFVFIYMFATLTEMYWLQVNYDGEYCYLMKQINNQDIAALCSEIANPEKRGADILNYLESATIDLSKAITFLTVAGESANMQEKHTLTERENVVVETMQYARQQVKQAISKAREL